VSGVGEIEVVQEVDAVPVLAPEPQRLELARSAAPATQAVAVAAGGFIAGAAVVGLVVRRRGKGSRALTRGRAGKGRRGVGRRSRKTSSVGELVQIVGTRSLLVDVHLLDGGR
jgi:hypothetical protein